MLDIIRSEHVYRGRVLNLRVDTVQLPGGGTAPWEIVEHRGAVAMIPLDGDDQVLLVRQYRHAAGQSLLEIPAGTAEPNEGREVTARRELREEVGVRAAHLALLAEFYLAPGYSTEVMQLYLATGLTPAPLAPDADEAIAVERMPFADLLTRVLRGEIRDSKTILATLLLAQRRAAGWEPGG